MKIKQKIDNLVHLITVRNYKFSENLHDETFWTAAARVCEYLISFMSAKVSWCLWKLKYLRVLLITLSFTIKFISDFFHNLIKDFIFKVWKSLQNIFLRT